MSVQKISNWKEERKLQCKLELEILNSTEFDLASVKCWNYEPYSMSLANPTNVVIFFERIIWLSNDESVFRTPEEKNIVLTADSAFDNWYSQEEMETLYTNAEGTASIKMRTIYNQTYSQSEIETLRALGKMQDQSFTRQTLLC